jgi:hypothetical protein
MPHCTWSLNVDANERLTLTPKTEIDQLLRLTLDLMRFDAHSLLYENSSAQLSVIIIGQPVINAKPTSKLFHAFWAACLAAFWRLSYSHSWPLLVISAGLTLKQIQRTLNFASQPRSSLTLSIQSVDALNKLCCYTESQAQYTAEKASNVTLSEAALPALGSRFCLWSAAQWTSMACLFRAEQQAISRTLQAKRHPGVFWCAARGA